MKKTREYETASGGTMEDFLRAPVLAWGTLIRFTGTHAGAFVAGGSETRATIAMKLM